METPANVGPLLVHDRVLTRARDGERRREAGRARSDDVEGLSASGVGHASSAAPGELFLRPPLAFELDPVIVRERSPYDALKVLEAPGGPAALSLGQSRLSSAQRLAPENIDGTLPAAVEELRGEIERVGHPSLHPASSRDSAPTARESDSIPTGASPEGPVAIE